ncbi:protein XRI1-like isoform X2 [Salvia miltiorrhiza]|uniref:protein XRI1-like isoform X2 n=1 Tax=Salvia miltiorrhiza TaxID=226208 RepID=UPI0025AB7D7E|nr:protein XRI1-like isoform X2 [Salvia miltiorrhiza]
MDYNCNEMWDWQGDDCSLEDNTSIEILTGLSQNEEQLPCSFDDETTPVKACGDLAHHVTNNEVTGKELEENREHPYQVKRRRMLQFESEVLDSPPFHEEMFLRSKETQDSLEDAITDMSEWVNGFAGPAEPSSVYLEEGWIAECFNDDEMHFNAEDTSAPEASDVQVDNGEDSNTAPEYDANAIEKHPVHSPGNVVFKGRKSYMRTPPKLASSVVYPFTFIKPCGVHGDVTLKDINKRIHTPPKSKQNEQDPSVPYPTSAFSGKPVVGKTKIRTEGGEGSITILRTRG